MQVTEQRYYTPEEYLEREEAADYKSEYIDGEIIPMAGGTIDHNRISLNLRGCLKSPPACVSLPWLPRNCYERIEVLGFEITPPELHLRLKPTLFKHPLSAALNFAFRQQDYEVFMGDVRLWIPQKRTYTYPDAMILVDESDFFNNRKDVIINPQVIVEVLSKSSKSYDREDKFQAYRTIPTFQEYLLIDQTKIHVEQFSKTGKKQWALREYDEEDEKVSLVTVPFEISIEDLYNKVKFEVVESQGEKVDGEDLG